MHPAWWFLLGLAAGVIVILPITRGLLRRVELRVRRAERRARDSERLAELGSMTGGLAHEIKNPLSTVGLNAQLLAESIRDSDLPEAQQQRMLRRLEGLSREVKRLGDILTDFLQFAGRIRLDPSPHDLNVIIEELADFFHPQCASARVTLRTQATPQPLMARVDETLFKQALLNLMINSVQAMEGDGAESGPRELMVRVEADRDEARVHVMDTGPGIESEKLERIFHPYVSHRTGGTGLGLPTARRIVEEHGGRLEAHSEPGRGSDFVIHLPLAPAD